MRLSVIIIIQRYLHCGKLSYLWKIIIFHVTFHYKWPFTIAMSVITRGSWPGHLPQLSGNFSARPRRRKRFATRQRITSRWSGSSSRTGWWFQMVSKILHGNFVGDICSESDSYFSGLGFPTCSNHQAEEYESPLCDDVKYGKKKSPGEPVFYSLWEGGREMLAWIGNIIQCVNTYHWNTVWCIYCNDL